MTCGMLTCALLAAMAMLAPAQSSSSIEKVFTMLADLEIKVQAQEAAAKSTFDKFYENFKEQSVEYEHQISTSKAEIEELEATIGKETATISKASSQIESLAASISSAEKELEAAKGIRTSEASDFAKEEAELSETIDTIERAISVLSKAGVSMLQTKNAGSLVQALAAMVQASVLTQADASRLTALTQTSQQTGDSDTEDDMMLSAPAAEIYEPKSGSILDTLDSLLEKAQTQLTDAQKTESTAIHNFELLAQSLSDEIKYATKDMNDAKALAQKSKETKGVAEGDLSVSKEDLAGTEAMLKELKLDAMATAEHYEEGKKNRGEELATIKAAIKALHEATGTSFLARDRRAMSFMQVEKTKIASGADLSDLEAVRFVRNLARKQHSAMLAQLASRMSTAMKMGVTSGEDVFAKVKGLIIEMIGRLEAERSADEDHKAYCDKQLSESSAKKEASTSTIKSLTVSLEQSKAHSAKLKGQIAELGKELAASSKAAAEAGILRKEEHDQFVKNKAELDTGIAGVQLALKVLKEYYAKGEASEETSGYATGIFSLLEVIESDLSKSLVEATQAEESAAAEYEKMVFAVKLSTASKEQDVKYKTKEAAGLDKKISELEGDLANEQTDLEATLETLEKLAQDCTSKVEPYEERVARRAAEITGLKEALSILEGETSLLQQKVRRHALRGLRAHKF